MTDYVTDTHPLIWLLFASNRLSTRVRDLFQRVDVGEDTIVIPAVVIAELIMVVEKRRVVGTMPELLQALALLQASANYRFPTLLPETVIASHSLTIIPDIFDRLIIAEARLFSAPLITRDTTMSASGLVTTVWD